MGGHSDLRVLLFVKIAMWAVLCFGLAALVVFKAVSAMREGRRYRFTFLDGGLLFRGKETSPRLMIGVAAAYAFGVSALLAWPLGLYRWVGEATSGCHDVIPMTLLAGGVIVARVRQRRAMRRALDED